jgi:hypothetical protein
MLARSCLHVPTQRVSPRVCATPCGGAAGTRRLGAHCICTIPQPAHEHFPRMRPSPPVSHPADTRQARVRRAPSCSATAARCAAGPSSVSRSCSPELCACYQQIEWLRGHMHPASASSHRSCESSSKFGIYIHLSLVGSRVLEAFSGPSLASPPTCSACVSMSSESSGGMHSAGRRVPLKCSREWPTRKGTLPLKWGMMLSSACLPPPHPPSEHASHWQAGKTERGLRDGARAALTAYIHTCMPTWYVALVECTPSTEHEGPQSAKRTKTG